MHPIPTSGPARSAVHSAMRTPGVTHDLPERKGPQKAGLTPEQVAKKVGDRLSSPVGQPGRVELTLHLVLPRAVFERLSARAVREGRSVGAIVAEVLERE
jgi:hypothetical protein